MLKAHDLPPVDVMPRTRELVDAWRSADDPSTVIQEIEQSVAQSNGFETIGMTEFKAATLNEFYNGVLMSEAIPDKYRTLAIEMSRQLQKDYRCQLISEKALAELAVVSYVRVLDLQERMMTSLSIQKALTYRHDTCMHSKDKFYSGDTGGNACQRTALELKLTAILGKELDRANRQYLSAVQMLQNLRQPSMQVNIRTQTAVVGQNQIVQANNYD
jgi:hypothetical protein